MAPPAGLEPATLSLTARCSTIELQGNVSMEKKGRTVSYPTTPFGASRGRPHFVPRTSRGGQGNNSWIDNPNRIIRSAKERGGIIGRNPEGMVGEIRPFWRFRKAILHSRRKNPSNLKTSPALGLFTLPRDQQHDLPPHELVRTAVQKRKAAGLARLDPRGKSRDIPCRVGGIPRLL